jgi:hypothetical protein
MRQVARTALVDGLLVGAALAICVVVLAILGLTPSLAWIPEVPLLAAGILIPLTAFALAGYRAGARSGRTAAGALAGGLTGAVAGTLGGLMYVAFGKPALNVAVGLVLGTAGGAMVGSIAALVRLRRGLTD